jgi:predicted DNA-binding protein
MDKFHHIGVRVNTRTKKLLKALCEQEHRTTSDYVRYLIEQEAKKKRVSIQPTAETV